MPLQLPNLDDRTYSDLVQEALTLIPANAPQWTNHNPSDPGITLVELLAYLTEMLIYRVNRITAGNVQKFLKLLNGPDWTFPPGADINVQVRQTVLALREIYRAVAQSDYELLSIGPFNQWVQSWQAKEKTGQPLADWWTAVAQPLQPADHLPSQIAPVARVHCVPQRNLDAGTETGRSQVRIDHLSMVVLPAAGTQPSQGQIDALLGFLNARRVVCTRIHVVGPWYVPVGVSVLVARQPDVRDSDMQARVQAALANFLAPLPITTGQGWPFGRDVFLSELYDMLELVPGLDFATGLFLSSSYAGTDSKFVPADSIWHDDGELVGLRLKEYQLPFLDAANLQIVVAPSTHSGAANFVVLQLTVSVTMPFLADRLGVNRRIRAVVNSFFLPFYSGPKPSTGVATMIYLTDVQLAVQQISGVLTVSMDAATSPTRARKQSDARGVYIQTDPGQVIDLQLTVTEKG